MEFSKSQNQNIYRTVRNFNRKIQRLHDKGYDVNLNKVTTKSVKAIAQTKGELNLYLRELELFGKRGAEVVNKVQSDGSEFLEYHKSIQDLQRKRALIQAKRELAYYSNRVPTSLGIKQAGTLKQMGSVLVRNLEKQVEVLSREDASKTVVSATKRVLESADRQQWFYGEFLGILSRFGEMCDVSNDKLDKIEEILRNIKPDKFTQMYNTEAIVKHIVELYNELHNVKSKAGRDSIIASGEDAINELYNTLQVIFKEYQG